MNTISDPDLRSQSGSSRWVALAHLGIMTMVCVVLLPAIGPGHAVGGGIIIRILFLGRMGLLIILATVLLKLRGLSWRDVGLRLPKWWKLGVGVVAGAVACFMTAALFSLLIKRLGLSAPNYKMFAPLKGNLPEFLFWVIPVSFGSAAFGEELLFRGFFINSVAAAFGAKGGSYLILVVLAQSIFFGALHLYQGSGGALTAGAIGLVLGLVWLLTGRNLWASIVIHALLDGSAMTYIYLKGPPG